MSDMHSKRWKTAEVLVCWQDGTWTMETFSFLEDDNPEDELPWQKQWWEVTAGKRISLLKIHQIFGPDVDEADAALIEEVADDSAGGKPPAGFHWSGHQDIYFGEEV